MLLIALLACLAAAASQGGVNAFPTSMYSCDNLPGPGSSLPGDGNQFMHIDSIQPGVGGYCEFIGLPAAAEPCKNYSFILSSSDRLAQLVAITNEEGKLSSTTTASSTSRGWTSKSDQCVAVNSIVRNFTYVWTAPPSKSGSLTIFSALCGKMGAVYSASSVSVLTRGDDDSACYPPPAPPAPPAACIVPKADITDNDSFDYYTLALQWPPGIAAVRGKEMQNAQCRDGLTLHGLWPSRALDPYTFAHDCTEVEYVPKDLNPSLRKQMNLHWPSLKQATLNDAFWNHEWQVHGTCAKMGDTFNDYFMRTLRLRSVFADNLEEHFFEQFPPSTLTRYRVEDIASFLGNGATLACTHDILTEFRFCVDKDTLEQRTCPPTVCNCNGTDRVFILPKDCSNGAGSLGVVWPAIFVLVLFTLTAPCVYCVLARKSATASVEDEQQGEEEGIDLESEDSNAAGRRVVIRRTGEAAPVPTQLNEDDFEI